MDDDYQPVRMPSLPYERELEPHDPTVERLPSKFIGSDTVTYGGDKLFYQE